MKVTSDQWQVTRNERNAATCEAPSRHGLRVTGHGSAFTLVEILLAMAIFSIVIAAIYSTWTLVLRATLVGQETAAQAQRQRIALRTIEDSLTCIQSFQASMKYYGFVVQSGDQSELSFTARLPEIFPRNGKFGGFNLRRLTFTVEPGPNSERDLVLRQNPVLMDMDPDERQSPLVLARNVRSFVVECLDTNTMDWATEWDNTNAIPTVVRLSLSLGGNTTAGGAAPELAVTRVVAMPSSTLPSGLQGNIAGVGAAPGGGGPRITLPTPKR